MSNSRHPVCVCVLPIYVPVMYLRIDHVQGGQEEQALETRPNIPAIDYSSRADSPSIQDLLEQGREYLCDSSTVVLLQHHK